MSFHRTRRISAAILTAIVIFFGWGIDRAAGEDMAGDAPVLYFFWGDGCPHCAEEKVFLETLKGRFPGLTVHSYEVWKNPANAAYFSRMLRASGIKSSGVPVTMIHTKTFVGFSPSVKQEIEAMVNLCARHACADPAGRLDAPLTAKPGDTLLLPVFGETDPARISLPLLTVVLGGLDSFNPCAFFVLFFLLSLLIHARSRKRMLLIGGTFVFFSGLIYFLFMAAWLNLFIIAGRLQMITAAAGAVALFVAAVNIKDFFFFKKGVSLSIPESAKPKLFDRMRGLLKSSSISSMIGGTIVLAVAANAYELLCTAGFPMVFTRVLTLQSLPQPVYYLYLALYNVVYVIPLLTIVVLFTVTLGARKLSEWQGRRLKLLSGLMMLFLGLILVIRPELLNNIFAASGLLAAALLCYALVVTIARKRMPGLA